MNTILFWIVWGLISLWVLKNFYFSFTKEKLDRLRKTALGLNLLILGLQLLGPANILVSMFVILLFISAVLLLSTNSLKLKIASVISIINTLAFFGIMFTIRPRTFILTIPDVFPILAALLLLINSVVVLLLWQQLQLKQKKK